LFPLRWGLTNAFPSGCSEAVSLLIWASCIAGVTSACHGGPAWFPVAVGTSVSTSQHTRCEHLPPLCHGCLQLPACLAGWPLLTCHSHTSCVSHTAGPSTPAPSRPLLGTQRQLLQSRSMYWTPVPCAILDISPRARAEAARVPVQMAFLPQWGGPVLPEDFFSPHGNTGKEPPYCSAQAQKLPRCPKVTWTAPGSIFRAGGAACLSPCRLCSFIKSLCIK
jgi:hypothetical protein